MTRIKNHLIEIVVSSAVILLLSIGTYTRNALWNDETGLWLDCIRKSPNKGRPYVNLGFAYFNAGDYNRSLELTKKALEIDSKSSSAYYNLSLTLHLADRFVNDVGIRVEETEGEDDSPDEMQFTSIGLEGDRAEAMIEEFQAQVAAIKGCATN